MPDTAAAASLWDVLRADLRKALRDDDPGRFLSWRPVRTTMVKRRRAPGAAELAHLRARPDWRSRWWPALRERTLGRPRPFHRMPSTSGAVIHHAYHLAQFEAATAGAWWTPT